MPKPIKDPRSPYFQYDFQRDKRRFYSARLEGEWFAPHPDILAEIARLSKGSQ